MIKAIEQVYKSRLQINENLQIHWADDQPLTFPGLAAKIENGLPIQFLSNRVQELEDLLRRLFHFADQIILLQQFWSAAGRSSLQVLVYTEGKEESMFVTVGQLDKVNREEENFVKYAPHVLHTGSLTIVDKMETVHYAAIASSLITDEANVESLISFPVYFNNHTERQVRSILEDLFQRTVKIWAGQGHRVDDQSLAQNYQTILHINPKSLKIEEFRHQMDELAVEGLQRGMPEIVFQEEELEFLFVRMVAA